MTHTSWRVFTHTHKVTPIRRPLRFAGWQSLAFRQIYSLEPYSNIPHSFFTTLVCSFFYWLYPAPYRHSAQPSLPLLLLSLSLFSTSLPPPPFLPGWTATEGGYHLSSLSNKLKWLLFGWGFFLPRPSPPKKTKTSKQKNNASNLMSSHR